MVTAIFLAGVLQVVTVGELIQRIEEAGHVAVRAEGLDRAAPLRERDAVSIGKEFGVVLTTQVPSREVDRVNLSLLVWLLTPQQQEERRRKHNHGHGKGKGHHKSEADPEGGL